MRWSIWSSWVVLVLFAGRAAAEEPPDIGWDSAGGGIEVGKFRKSHESAPPERDSNDSGDAGPSKPRGPTQRQLQDRRWAAELYRQGKAAADRKKYDDAIRHFE